MTMVMFIHTNTFKNRNLAPPDIGIVFSLNVQGNAQIKKFTGVHLHGPTFSEETMILVDPNFD